MSTADRHKTTIQRWSPSRSVALALDDGLLSKKTTFFDYGCGRGGELMRFHKMGVPVSGWAPAFFPDEERTPADVVRVLDDVDDVTELGAVALRAAWELALKLLIVSARLAVHLTIRRSCVAAAPGVFYVFRDTAEEHSFVAGRLTRPRYVPMILFGEEVFERRQAILKPVMEFVSQRRRLPVDFELEGASQIKEIFGGIARTFSVIRRVTEPDQRETICRECRNDLLVHPALAAFRKRPKLGSLPDTLGYALYTHHTALPDFPPLLGIYDVCGRQLAGAVEGLTLVKLSRYRPQVSCLVYPDFDGVGHPVLTEAFVANLSRQSLHHRAHRRSRNPSTSRHSEAARTEAVTQLPNQTRSQLRRKEPTDEATSA